MWFWVPVIYKADADNIFMLDIDATDKESNEGSENPWYISWLF